MKTFYNSRKGSGFMTWYRKLWVACMPLLLFLPIVSIMASISQLLAEILPFMTLFVRLDALYAKVLPFLLAGFVSYQFCRHKDGSVVLSAMIAYLLIISVLQSEVLNEAFAYQWHVDVAVDYIQNPYADWLRQSYLSGFRKYSCPKVWLFSVDVVWSRY